ncbi:transcriptional regulator [Enterococcus sp. CU12B]|uniref:Transcriptional regulator n=2 Tax=Enterococcus TaxID=1350 RepID=A0ABQ6Z335_9ENTE|nr:transcriptional regulator [Enterococcus sp. CU12B]
MEVFIIYIVDLVIIKAMRLEKGYSLQKMVNLMGILDKTKYYRREKGEVHFRPEELLLVANVLDVPLEKLFTQKNSEE